MQRIHSGVIDLSDGDAQGVKSPVDVGTGKAKEEKAPLSEIIKVLNDKFATNFTEEDRLFFEQIREKAAKSDEIVKLKQANPFDKFQLGLKELVAKLMIQRLSDNDKIVTRYMDDKDFESAAFSVLSRAIYDSIPKSRTM
jgi:type I restriction enzyme R subunit